MGDAQTQPKVGSSALARLHLERLLGRVSLPLIAALANRVAWRRSVLALVIACLCCGVVIFDPFRVLEGVDVLLARRGVAPLDLDWLADPALLAEPPAYLHDRTRELEPLEPASLEVGTVLVVGGRARRSGRHLVLTDGKVETPLVEDGQGGLVARWTVLGDTELRVAARFGDVLVLDENQLDVRAIKDLTPIVRLEGAPRTIALLDEPRVAVHYEAADDHGLRQVELVLRAGAREERRPLSQPKGNVRFDRGGVDLRLDDDIFKRSFLPVEVMVEAEDNDAVTGPKWGRSAAIIVVPPRIGEREAMRYGTLEKARDLVTDLLAERLGRTTLGGAELTGQAPAERTAQERVLKQVNPALQERFGGLGFGGSMASLVAGQLERLGRAMRGFEAQPGAKTHAALVTATERTVLALDAVLGVLDDRDSRSSALKLSEVATEVASSIALGRATEERGRADRRVDAALSVLDGGAAQLLRLGWLGKDLGETVQNGLRRIHRALDAGDRFHARLAAEDLAARLRVPDPAFRSAGGGGAAGVESGGGSSGGDQGGDSSQAAQDAAEMDQAMDQLRREHASETSRVARALEQGMNEADRSKLTDELRQHAEAVRQAVQNLPRTGGEASPGRSAASAARAQAEAMATALDRGDLKGAVAHGKDAQEALDTAAELGREAPAGSEESAVGASAAQSRAGLSPELSWAERELDKLEQQASERAAAELESAAQREKELGQRARELREQSERGAAPLPQAQLDRLGQAADAMGEASKLLGERKGPHGLARQRDAQQLLEMSEPETESTGERPSPAESSGADSADGTKLAQDVDVPGEHRDKRAEDFRKRVTSGLRGPIPPHLREALRRYVEGLLR